MKETAFERAFPILKAIDVDYAARIKTIHATAEDGLKLARQDFNMRRMEIERRRKVSLSELAKWRSKLLKAAGALPVNLSDIASVKRETASGAVVSLPRVPCLEKRA